MLYFHANKYKFTELLTYDFYTMCINCCPSQKRCYICIDYHESKFKIKKYETKNIIKI